MLSINDKIGAILHSIDAIENVNPVPKLNGGQSPDDLAGTLGSQRTAADKEHCFDDLQRSGGNFSIDDRFRRRQRRCLWNFRSRSANGPIGSVSSWTGCKS